MILLLKTGADELCAQKIMTDIEQKGLKPLFLPGTERIVIGVIGDERMMSIEYFSSFDMVEEVKRVLSPYKLVSKEFKKNPSIVYVKNIPIGGDKVQVIAGPCSVESNEQIESVAPFIKEYGASLLRGGAFKPRTSPYSFQGLGEEGLKILQDASKKFDLPIVTEVMDISDIDLVAKYADCLQIGARNMQNFSLLKEIGLLKKPILLKRGISATIEELLLAAEYIMSKGNDQIILCERGIRTFENSTRNTLDLNAVPVLKHKTHLPVIVDPSHGTGVRAYVAPMAYAAIACGADGLILEVHPSPKDALSDGAQSLHIHEFEMIMKNLHNFCQAAGRKL